MKKLIVLLGLFCAMPVFADNAAADDGSGFVVGFNAGTAKIDYQPYDYNYLTQSAPATSISHDSGFAWNGYFGYLLYKQFGWDLGYMGYQTATFNYNGAPNSVKVKRHDYDILMRGDYPFTTNFIGFVRVGVARVNGRVEINGGSTTNIAGWTPAYGVGVAYSLTAHTELNVQWLHLQQLKSNAHTPGAPIDMPSTNYASLGWRYRF